MARRTQNRQECNDSQEGAGQPVEFQAVNVEYHRQRIARRPVGARAKPLPRRLSGKLRPRRVLQDSEQSQRRSTGAPAPTARLNSTFMWSQEAAEKP